MKTVRVRIGEALQDVSDKMAQSIGVGNRPDWSGYWRRKLNKQRVKLIKGENTGRTGVVVDARQGLCSVMLKVNLDGCDCSFHIPHYSVREI